MRVSMAKVIGALDLGFGLFLSIPCISSSEPFCTLYITWQRDSKISFGVFLYTCSFCVSSSFIRL